jgi:hypothetical protein
MSGHVVSSMRPSGPSRYPHGPGQAKDRWGAGPQGSDGAEAGSDAAWPGRCRRPLSRLAGHARVVAGASAGVTRS